jgi:hypothetical protein
VPPPNFCDPAKINAKFGQNTKILICPEKIFVSLRKLRDVRENSLICPAKFSYVCTELFCMSGKFFLVCPDKIFGDPIPPARQQFWGEILMFSLPVRANYTVPPHKQD